MSEFLLEILAEEIPAGVLPSVRKELLQNVARALADEEIGGTFFIHSTSRRLILTSVDLPEAQESYETEIVGPPATAAFDADGRPTRAAIGFARAQGVEPEDLLVVTLAKGKYAVARKLIEGKTTMEILAEVIPPIVEKLAFPRMMRWGDGAFQWVRPVHSVIALFDGMVIPLTLFGVEAGRVTTGHRTLSDARLISAGLEDYFGKLRKAFVEPDYAVRRRALSERAEALAAEVGGVPALDSALFDTLAHLVEQPGLVRGTFPESYLDLPDEILVTTMREHQKVLPVRTPEGALAPYFLAVADQTGDPKGLIVKGNEWVINARFADARFFYDEDAKTSLESRLPRLSRLGFQEKLGDYGKKTERVTELTATLVEMLGRPDLMAPATRAARLLKTDLVTDMVREFTDLQGVVGGLYARREGESEEVWQAIYDQYLPASAEGLIPRGDAGCVAALADRLDTLAGLFGLGLVPTGSKDPYALRRAALGVVKIVLDKEWRIDLSAASAEAWKGYGPDVPGARAVDDVMRDLWVFLLERLRFLLERRGLRHDEIESVLTTDCRDVTDARERAEAVAAIRKREDFGPLSVAFKRIQNILAQAGEGDEEPDPALFSEEAEKLLAADYFQARGMLDVLVARRRYEEALGIMASLGPSLDNFFIQVMVMAEDPALRRNRLALLRSMRNQFFRVARFSEIQG